MNWFFSLYISLAGTFVGNLIVLLRSNLYKALPFGKKVLHTLIAPLLRLVFCFKVHRSQLSIQLRHHDLLSSSDSSEIEADLEHKRVDVGHMKDLLMKFKANELVAEHFIQMLVVLIVALVEESKTSTVATLSRILLSEDDDFTEAALGLSFASLVIGHVMYIRRLKNGFLQTKTLLLQLVYFSLSAGGRLFSLVVYTAPALGLYDTMYHAKFASLSGQFSRHFGYHPNGTEIWMLEAWAPFQYDPFDSLWFKVTFIATLPIVLFLHILVLLLVARYFKTHPDPETKHWQVVYAMVCPPLFDDWQVMYTSGGGGEGTAPERIRQCWTQSWSAYLCSVGLFAFESIVPSIHDIHCPEKSGHGNGGIPSSARGRP